MAKFEVAKLQILGNPNIGVYIHVTNKLAFVPPGLTHHDLEVIRSVLGVELVEAVVSGMRLLGIMMAGNDNGVILSKTVSDEELQAIKKAVGDMNVAVLPSTNNAVGNLIAANNRGAIVYPGLEDDAAKVIEDTLGVEVVKAAVAGTPVVGSVIVVNNRGGLVHPDASEDEIKTLTDIFKVPIVPGTVNFGVSLVRTGLVANDRGAIAGEDTTGPELARIQMALGGESG